MLIDATKYLDAGDRINELLSQRADIPTDARRDAGRLRNETLGMANRLRAEIAREVSKTPSLPRDLEQRLFGYLDTLTAMQAAPGQPVDPAAPPAPGSPTVTPIPNP